MRTLFRREVPVRALERVLFLTRIDAHRAHLQQILAGTRWELVPATECREAVERLRREVIPVAIIDRDLPGAGWRENLARLASVPHPACVILASRVSDSYLWEEVVHRGGFDILVLPFDSGEVIRMLNFAHWQWSTWWHARNVNVRNSMSHRG
jgi:DNA-binding NtrC family response regulator